MNKQRIVLLIAGIGLLQTGQGFAEPIDSLSLHLIDRIAEDRKPLPMSREAIPPAPPENAGTQVAQTDSALSLKLIYDVATLPTDADISQGEFRHPNTVFSAGYSVMRDSNFFRLSSAADTLSILGTPQKSETVRRADAGVEWRMKLSRQLVTLKGEASQNTFEHFDKLNYTGRTASARWDGEIGTHLNWSADYSVVRTLGSMADVQSVISNVLDQKRAFLDIGYWLDPRWQLRAGVSGYELTHLAKSREDLDREENSAEVGIHYLGTGVGGRIIGLAKITEVHFPHGFGCTAACDYQHSAASVSVFWPITGITQLNAQLGYTEIDRSNSSGRDFAGPTGRVTMHTLPTGKTTIDLSMWREITAVEDLSANYIVSKGGRFSLTWAATEKIRVEGHHVSESQDYRGAASISILDAQTDTVRRAGIGLTYKAARSIQFSLTYDAESRSSNRPLRDYQFERGAVSMRADF